VYECTFLRLFNVYVCSTGQYLVSGSHDGSVLVWDTNSTPIEDTTLSDPVIQPKLRFQAQFDTVNGVRYYNFLFLTLYFCLFCLLIRFFITATTANDLLTSKIFILYIVVLP